MSLLYRAFNLNCYSSIMLIYATIGTNNKRLSIVFNSVVYDINVKIVQISLNDLK